MARDSKNKLKNIEIMGLWCLFFLCKLFGGVLSESDVETSILRQSLQKNNTRRTCDMDIKEEYGLIQSPGYPEKYPRYRRCQYTVYRASKEVCELKLTFEHFDVYKMYFSDCSEDFFEIQDREKRYRICGQLRPGAKKFVFFPPNSDKLVFKFQSTFHNNPGFSIQVKQLYVSCFDEPTPAPWPSWVQAGAGAKKNHTEGPLDGFKAYPPCVQMITGRTSRIVFPDSTMDEDLPPEQCSYKIQKSEPQACIVQMDLLNFEVPRSADCEMDYLQLPNGRRLCGTLGGKRELLQFQANSSEMVLEFVSSSQNASRFDIQLSQLPGPCDYRSVSERTGLEMPVRQCDQTMHQPTGRMTSPGFPRDFGPNNKCTYRIFRPDVSVCQLELDFKTFNFGRHNPLGCHYGAFLELPGRERLCHDFVGTKTIQVTEFKDPVEIVFYSDSSTSGRGFDIEVKQVPNTCPEYKTHPMLPKAIKRCYQEVSAYNGYFTSNSHHIPISCEFVIRQADPTVCKVNIQLTARDYFRPPCYNNFIWLPSGEQMCILPGERRELWIPEGRDYLILEYHNRNNPNFYVFVEQVKDSCRAQNFFNYKPKKRRWITPSVRLYLKA